MSAASKTKAPDESRSSEQEFPPLIPIPRGKPKGRILLLIGGVILILAGAALGLLPGAPGLVLGVPGVFMLSLASPPVGRWINRHEEKLSPKWRKRLRPKIWWKARRALKKRVDAI
jgi:hypothetical protein